MKKRKAVKQQPLNQEKVRDIVFKVVSALESDVTDVEVIRAVRERMKPELRRSPEHRVARKEVYRLALARMVERRTVIKGISRSRALRSPIDPHMIVSLKEKGNTRIQAGSLRDKVIKALGKHGGSLRVDDAAWPIKKPAVLRGVIAKLREAGWVEVQ